MIDIENYKRAIAWLRRGLNEYHQDPKNKMTRLDILHRFKVTHNVTEATLREAYVLLDVDEQAPYLSVRELFRRSREEGLRVPSPKQWLEYALLLETFELAWLESAKINLESLVAVLPAYALDLESFAESLTKRMAKFV